MATVQEVFLTTERLKTEVLDSIVSNTMSSIPGNSFAVVEEALNRGYIWSVSELHIQLDKAVQV